MTDKIDEIELQMLVRKAIQEHGKSREALIPILAEVNQVYGHIPTPAYQEIKRQINLPDDQERDRLFAFVSESQLYGLASFYHMLSTEPVGRHVIRFCESAPCHVMGGRQLFEAIKDELQLQPGETSQDGRWTFFTTSCLGTCGVGPVILVDEDIYGNVTPDQLPGIFARYP